MEDRAQVILIITGLGGATPLEKALPGMERAINSAKKNNTHIEENSILKSKTQSELSISTQTQDVNSEYSNAVTNLDLPAFMRKRSHLSG